MLQIIVAIDSCWRKWTTTTMPI